MPLEGHIFFIFMITLFIIFTLLSFFTDYLKKWWQGFPFKFLLLEKDEKSFVKDSKIIILIGLSFFIILYITAIIKTC